MAAQKPEFIDAVQQAVPREGLERKGDRHARSGSVKRRASRSIFDFGPGMVYAASARWLRRPMIGQQAVLQGIAAKDVGDFRADDGAKAEVQQRPRCMLARGAAAEVAAGDQHLRSRLTAGRLRRSRAAASRPTGSASRRTTAGPGRSRSVVVKKRAGMIWSVSILLDGMHNGAVERTRTDGLHYSMSRGSVMRPRTALAAAVAGTCQQRAGTHALPALEISIAGAERILAGGDRVAVHSEAHRAAGFAPVGAGRLEYVGDTRPLGCYA